MVTTTERRHPFGEPLRAARPHFQGGFGHGQPQHEMRREGSDNAANDLREHVKARFLRPEIALESKDEADGRIEIRAGNRPQNCDQHHENRARRQCVAKEARVPSFVNVSAMMPDPTTVATRNPVPSASAAIRRASVVFTKWHAASLRQDAQCPEASHPAPSCRGSGSGG
jgi:hypothetical protein